MNRTLHTCVFALSAAVLILALTCSAAFAGPMVAARPRDPISRIATLNWSGYAVETSLAAPQTGSVSDVVGTWQVPFVTGSSNAWSSAWIGIDGYSSASVEQIGTDQDTSRRGAHYYAWYEMYPGASHNITSLAVNPGNVITAEVRYVGSNQYVLKISNTSAGGSFQTTQTLSASRTSAEWIMEAPSSGNSVLPLANFGTANFSACNATLNGVAGPIGQWAYDPITMVGGSSRRSYTKATPSALTGGGTAFSVTWSHQ